MKGGDLVNEIRRLRKQRGYTIRQLGIASGVHYVSICKYETGKAVPSIRNITRLADALGVTVNDLIGSYTAPTGDEKTA